MTFLRFITLVFIAFALARTYLQYRKKTLDFSNFLFWIFIWLLALVFIFDPNLSSIIAGVTGMGRGIDAMFLIAIVMLFYLVFKIYLKIDALDKNLTTLTINLSKKLHKQENDRN